MFTLNIPEGAELLDELGEVDDNRPVCLMTFNYCPVTD
ncbi:hypothetical protein SAMN04489713_101736 [Actinomadura madurae]|uniref:Uncharacterized protein n=1 Tax=Actinomadura madurae TaxID=1993 RepID=A0A1I4X8K1_9ACTN|nr:hypothetical protein SAMN04489713_101736 [Actinomadura madurae]SPT63353.1 Uncharacterised protein [Actinomadura madurae]